MAVTGYLRSSTSSAFTYILDNTHHALHSTHSWRKKPCRTCRLQRHSFHASPTSDTDISAYIRVPLKPTVHLYHHRTLNGPTTGRGKWRTIRLPRAMRALWEREKAADSMMRLFSKNLANARWAPASCWGAWGTWRAMANTYALDRALLERSTRPLDIMAMPHGFHPTSIWSTPVCLCRGVRTGQR